jgi:NitT/TauT family transport system substrate-binding protein
LHIGINIGFSRFARDVRVYFGLERESLRVGFLPVTCHLTCPVIDWTTRKSSTGALFESKRYSDFATASEDLNKGTLGVAFLNAPLAISLKMKGLPVRIISLGHRDGTTLVVGANSSVTHFAQLRGKKILVPSKFSNQQLWLTKLCKENGMTLADLELRECPPPDMPAMLESGNCDAYCIGEPHAARAEMAGTGRVLLHVKDSWPNFISCVAVAREDVIAAQREMIQELVDGIAGSGLWLEQGQENRFSAAEVAGKYYYNQNPELLKWVLSKPVDRVRYDELDLAREDFEEIVALAVEFGMFPKSISYDEFADPSFTANAAHVPIPMPPDDGLGPQTEIVARPAAASPSTPSPSAASPAQPQSAPASR